MKGLVGINGNWEKLCDGGVEAGWLWFTICASSLLTTQLLPFMS
jgi:hypothetical protein